MHVDRQEKRKKERCLSLPFLFKVKKFGAKLEWENWSQFRTDRPDVRSLAVSFVDGGCKERVSHHRQSHFVGAAASVIRFQSVFLGPFPPIS